MRLPIIPRSSSYLSKVARFRAMRGMAIRAQKRLEVALRLRTASARELERLQEFTDDLWIQCGRARTDLARARCEETKRMEVAA